MRIPVEASCISPQGRLHSVSSDSWSSASDRCVCIEKFRLGWRLRLQSGYSGGEKDGARSGFVSKIWTAVRTGHCDVEEIFPMFAPHWVQQGVQTSERNGHRKGHLSDQHRVQICPSNSMFPENEVTNLKLVALYPSIDWFGPRRLWWPRRYLIVSRGTGVSQRRRNRLT